MKRTMTSDICWLQITAGRGPLECCWVVHRLSREIEKQAMLSAITARVAHAIPAEKPQTCRSILLKLYCQRNVDTKKSDTDHLDDLLSFARKWSGTVQ